MYMETKSREGANLISPRKDNVIHRNDNKIAIYKMKNSFRKYYMIKYKARLNNVHERSSFIRSKYTKYEINTNICYLLKCKYKSKVKKYY